MKPISQLGIALGGLFLASLPVVQGAGLPKVSVEKIDAANLRLSWPQGSDNLVLEEADRVGSTTQWRPSSLAPVLNGTLFAVTAQAAGREHYFRLRGQNTQLTQIVETSPVQGEVGVAVTRETILHFSNPLAVNTSLTSDQFHAEAAGRRILSRIELSSDRRTATLFYLEPLPGSTRVTVMFDGTGLADFSGRPIDPDGDGRAGGSAIVAFETLSVTPVTGTAVLGRVFASELVPGAGTGTNAANRPLEGVTITVDGMEETLRAITDATGNFKLEPAPAGRFFVKIDGRTAKDSQYPNGAYYPYVGKAWDAVAGKADNLAGGTGEIYLPLIIPGTLQPVSATTDTMVSFPPSVVASNPALTGVSVIVPANSLFSDNGTRGGKVGIAPVPPNRLPGPLPPGLEFPIVITVQTDGPLNFDKPAPVCFPNLPDPVTGQSLPPGTKQSLISFNHKKGIWEAVGPMTVGADGKFICTDPGVGILQPGWHGSGPPPVGPPPPPPGPQCGGGGGSSLALENLSPGLAVPNPGLDKCISRCRTDFYVCAGFTAVGTIVCAVFTLGGCTPVGGAALAYCVTTRLICGHRCEEDNPCPPSSALSEFRQAAHTVSPQSLAASDPILDQIIEKERQINGLTYPYIIAGNPIPPDVQNQVNTLQGQADTLAGGNAEQYLGSAILQLDSSADAVAEVNGNAPPYPVLYLAVIQRPAGSLLLRGETGPFGQYTLFVPRDGTLLYVSFYDPRTKAYGLVAPHTRSNPRYLLPRFDLAPVDENYMDSDHDGLPDVVELVYGTDPNKADTDGDGISDGAEVGQGLDPLSGLTARTGIIASADTPGNAVDICALNDLAMVADSQAGVSVFNVFNGLNPTLVAQVDTPGNARAVACSGNLIAVADDTAGLAIIDISVPANARIVHQINLGGVAQAVTVAGGMAYVGLNPGQLVGVDLASGAVLEKLKLSGEVHDLAVEGETLFCLLNNELRAYKFSDGSLEFLGASTPPSFSPGSFNRLRRLFVGGGYAYVSGYPDYDTFDVRDATAIKKVGTAKDVPRGPNSFKQIVANGSGLGIAAVGAVPRDDGTHDVYLYDVSDPAVTTRFLTTFVTPGITHAVTVYNGLAYAADGTAGLQVVNYLAYDTKGVPPTINLAASFSLNPPQAEENKSVVISASVTDDVQVRNVEFYLDEVKTLTDGNFPFEFHFTTPSIANNRTSFRLRAKATDTGGNSTWTPEITVKLVADGTPPRVKRVTPLGGGRAIDTLTAYFNEPIELASLIGNGFKVFSAGPNGRLDTTDDVPLGSGTVSFRNDVNAAVLTFASPLPDGLYRAVLSTAITDLAGNHMPSEFSWYFRVADAVFWISEADGSWEDPLNWSTGSLPGAADNVIIDVPGDVTVTLVRITTRIRSLALNNNLTVDGGTIQGATIIRSPNAKLVFTRNAQNYLDGATVEGDLDLSAGGYVRILNGLTLTTGGVAGGTVRIDNGGILAFEGTQTFGPGTIEFLGSSAYVGPAGDTVLTLGSGVLAHGKTGSFQAFFDARGTPTLINQGTISADVAGGTFTIATKVFKNTGTVEMKNGGDIMIKSETWSNAGAINAATDSQLSLTGTWMNTGTITLAGGSTFTLNGDWVNTGTIQANNVTVNLNHAANTIITLAKLGTFNRAGATVNLMGTLDNVGKILALDATSGLWVLSGGTIKGGTVTQAGGVRLRIARNGQNYLDGVTVEGDLDLSDGGYVHILNGLTLTASGVAGGTVRIDNSGILAFDGTQTFGPATIEFLGNSGYVGPVGDTVLTLGSGVLAHGKTGSFQALFDARGTPTLINQGTISADVAGGTLTIATKVFQNTGTVEMKNGGDIAINSETWSNAGAINATTGSQLSLTGTWMNTGTITLAGGSTFTLNGDWVNTGTIQANNVTVNLNHAANTIITLAKLGTFNRAGATVNLMGTLDNVGKILALDATSGLWVLSGGTIKGGTVTQAGGVKLRIARNGQNYLDGVTVEGDLDLSDGGYVRILNGLTLTTSGAAGGTVRIDNSGILAFDGTQTFGPATIEFLGNSGYVGPVGDTILTLGSGVLAHGKTGSFQALFDTRGTPTLIDQGTISADVAGGTLTIATKVFQNTGTVEMKNGGDIAINSETWSNAGAINATTGSQLSLTGTWMNTGTITLAGGSTFTLNGDWANTGTIQANNVTVNLNHAANAIITLAKLGAFNRAGATVNLMGTLDNVGKILALDATSGLWVLSGGTIKGGTVTQAGGVKLRFVRNGQNYLDGVTVEGDLDLSDGGYVRILNGLTLTTGGVAGGAVRIDNSGILAFDGTQTFGPATIEFLGNSGYVGPVGDTILTLESGVLAHGKTGSFQALLDARGTPILINQGTISADVAGGTLTITTKVFQNTGTVEMKNGGDIAINSETWSNAGAINATTGSQLSLTGTWMNTGTITLAGGSTFTLNGDWVNTGTIQANNVTVNLNHTANAIITLAKLGTFNRAGATVNLMGTLDNVGKTLALDATSGLWVLSGGTIKGGTVTQAGGVKLRIARNGQNYLDGVTVEGDLDLSDGGYVRILNGLTLTTGGAAGGTVRIDNGGTLAFAGTQTFGPATIQFLGSSGYLGMAGDATLTLSNGVLVHGKTGNIGQGLFDNSGTQTLVNQGTISADVVGGTLTINPDVFKNTGTLQELNGGKLVVPP